MNRVAFIKRVASLVLVTLSLLFFVNYQTSAQTNEANAAQGLQISPPRVELNAVKGGKYNIDLKVTNITASDLSYTSSIVDFNSSDREDGSPNLVEDSTLSSTASIRTWVSNTPEFTLEARQSTTLRIEVSVPKNAEPGGHYGALLFSGKAPDIDTTGVGLSASAGTLILVRVEGDIKETADLASFFSAKDGSQTSFFENGPIGFVTRIKNDGNVHIKPTGNIELRDMFGNLVATMAVNEGSSNVLPNSIRKFESNYDGVWMFGRYTANLAIGYGTTGQAITKTISFWVIPYKIIAAVLLVIITAFFVLRRLIKVYNRRIIEKARKNETNKNKDQKRG